MKVYFEKVVLPCVVDDVIAWHVSHGWVWDVVEVPTRIGTTCEAVRMQDAAPGKAARGSAPNVLDRATTPRDASNAPQGKARRVAVFFCTLLCGDGVICHFSTVPGIDIPWPTTLAAMRKGIRMVAPAVNVVFATIPADDLPLLRCACRLGFRISCGSFDRDGRKIRLLQYYSPEKR